MPGAFVLATRNLAGDRDELRAVGFAPPPESKVLDLLRAMPSQGLLSGVSWHVPNLQAGIA